MTPKAQSAHPGRSALYLPASNSRAIEKARTLPADSIVFDLEDAVAPAAKAKARENLRAAFAGPGFGNSQTVIRTNSIGSADYLLDLQTINACAPDAVLLPKVSIVAEIEQFSADAERIGLSNNLQSWFMIETVTALTRLPALIEAGVKCDNQLTCLIVGTNDIAKESAISTVNERQYLVPWLMQIVLAAKAGGVFVLDGVWNDFKNTEGFDKETAQAVKMGFDGKTLIHPSQIDSANRLFSPSPEQLAQARAIVAAFSQPGNEQLGVINLNGEMVERLHLEQALRLLAVADQA